MDKIHSWLFSFELFHFNGLIDFAYYPGDRAQRIQYGYSSRCRITINLFRSPIPMMFAIRNIDNTDWYWRIGQDIFYNFWSRIIEKNIHFELTWRLTRRLVQRNKRAKKVGRCSLCGDEILIIDSHINHNSNLSDYSGKLLFRVEIHCVLLCVLLVFIEFWKHCNDMKTDRYIKNTQAHARTHAHTYTTYTPIAYYIILIDVVT